MRINEIESVFDLDEIPEKYAYEFTDTTKIEKLSTGMLLKIVEKDDSLSFGIFDPNDVIISYVSLHKEGKFWQVDMTNTIKEYRGQGYIRRILEIVMDRYGSIISDNRHTNDAQMMWKSLIKHPNSHSYFMINLVSNEKVPLLWDNSTNNITPNPWNENDKFVILGTSRVDEYTIESRQKRYERDIKRGRDSDIWLGPKFKDFNP